MQRVRVLVARPLGSSADTSVEWYGDLGTGVVDYGRALPPGRKPLWPEAPRSPGHALTGHLMVGHLSAVQLDGHVEGVHLDDAHLESSSAIVFDSPRYVFGRFVHALRMFDGAGNASAQGGMEIATTINSSPPVPRGLRRGVWNAETSQLGFEFDPVRFTPVAGN